MIVYIIEMQGLRWSSKHLWGDFPDIYPSKDAAEKILKSTPTRPSKPRWNADFYGYDSPSIKIVPYTFEELK